MKKVTGILVVVLAMVFSTTAMAKDYFWNEEVIEASVDKNVKVGIEQQFKFSGDLSEEATALYFSFKVGDFTIVPGFRHSSTLKNGDWAKEYRTRVDIINSGKVFDIKFTNRVRVENRDLEGEDELRVREKFTLISSTCYTNLKVKPYIADEVFYTESQGFNRNRITGGLLATEFLIKPLSLDVYYMAEQNKNAEDNATIGTKLKLTF